MIKYNGMAYEIGQEDCPENPRYWENLGTIYGSSRSYDLVDVKARAIGEDYEDDLRLFLKDGYGLTLKDVIYLPVYMYQHGGIALNTTGFSSKWDSGQLGFIFATKSEIRTWFDCKRISKKTREKTYESFKNSVKELGQWANGDVFYVTIYDEEGEEVESCDGIYGRDEAERFAESSIDYFVNKKKEV